METSAGGVISSSSSDSSTGAQGAAVHGLVQALAPAGWPLLAVSQGLGRSLRANLLHRPSPAAAAAASGKVSCRGGAAAATAHAVPATSPAEAPGPSASTPQHGSSAPCYLPITQPSTWQPLPAHHPLLPPGMLLLHPLTQAELVAVAQLPALAWRLEGLVAAHELREQGLVEALG